MRKSIATAAAAAFIAWAGISMAQDVPGGTSSVAVAAEGKKVYAQICQACHMADAKGGRGAAAKIPALAGNPKLANKDFVILQMVQGKGAMPPMVDILTPKQMAAVATYVRTNFNKFPGTVTEPDVRRVAATVKKGANSCTSC